MKCVKTINGSFFDSPQSLAVYEIKRNKKISYEMAYTNYFAKDIIIYDLVNENVKYTMENTHSDEIMKIKHYYYQKKDQHLLLTSSKDLSFSIYLLSSFPLSLLFSVQNAHDGLWCNPFCLVFNESTFYVIGGTQNSTMKIWDHKAKSIGIIHQSTLEGCLFLEAEEVQGEEYVILGGLDHVETLRERKGWK